MLTCCSIREIPICSSNSRRYNQRSHSTIKVLTSNSWLVLPLRIKAISFFFFIRFIFLTVRNDCCKICRCTKERLFYDCTSTAMLPYNVIYCSWKLKWWSSILYGKNFQFRILSTYVSVNKPCWLEVYCKFTLVRICSVFWFYV